MSAIDKTPGLADLSPITPNSKGSSAGKASLSQAERTQIVAERSLIGDLLVAAFRSRILRAVVLTAGAVLVASFVFHLSFPLIAAVAGGVFLTMLLFPNPLTAKREILFELDNLRRLFTVKNYDSIKVNDIDTNILLGAMPNRLRNDGKALKNEGVAAVISLNEDWERVSRASMVPFQADDYRYFGINHYNRELEVEDHCVLTDSQSDTAAKFISEKLNQNPNKKVYVHCKAGLGRSAYAVAAYLIKYKEHSASDAIKAIKKSRPQTTLHKKKKVEALENYEKYCRSSSQTK